MSPPFLTLTDRKAGSNAVASRAKQLLWSGCESAPLNPDTDVEHEWPELPRLLVSRALKKAFSAFVCLLSGGKEHAHAGFRGDRDRHLARLAGISKSRDS